MSVMRNDSCSMTMDEIRSLYELEKVLAARLRSANRLERRTLYQAVYEELYRQAPFHPMLTRKANRDDSLKIRQSIACLHRLLRAGSTVLEVGAGDCRVAFEVAAHVGRVYGLEVSRTISDNAATPANFELLISDGIEIPLPNESVDLVFSDQLMEHLHPDDALEQLRNIAQVLKPGGAYVCITPHRLYGPTDVSKYFDDAATCFHLKEYTYRELDHALREAGFARTSAYLNKGLRYAELPMAAVLGFEALAQRLFGSRPYDIRQRWMRQKPFSALQRLQIVGYKA